MKSNFFLLVYLFLGIWLYAQYNADPNERWRDFGNMNEDILENGNASHNLSPAELFYYCAKENGINPVLLLSKVQDEQSLLEQGSNLEARLLKATGYGYSDGGTNPYWQGFYPQLVSCTFQFRKYHDTYNKTFRQAYETYTTGVGKYDNFVNNLYPVYAAKMNSIAGTNYSTHPSSDGYYFDFQNVTVDNIQAFLEQCNGELKNQNLFGSAASTNLSLDNYNSSTRYSENSLEYTNRLYGTSYTQMPQSNSNQVGYITLEYLETTGPYPGSGNCSSCNTYIHKGLDQGSNGVSVPIYSPLEGQIIKTNATYGTIAIYTSAYDFTWFVTHCESISVQEGEYVNIGDFLGYSGQRGNAYGIHTHTVIRRGNNVYMPCPCTSPDASEVYDPRIVVDFFPVSSNNPSPVVSNLSAAHNGENVVGLFYVQDENSNYVKNVRVWMKRVSPNPTDWDTYYYDVREGTYDDLLPTGWLTFDINDPALFDCDGTYSVKIECWDSEVYDHIAQPELQANVVHYDFEYHLAKPDLTVSNLVISNQTGATSDATEFYSNEDIYLNYDLQNIGNENAGPFYVGIYVDGTQIMSPYENSLPVNSMIQVRDINIGQLSAGYHSIRVFIDKNYAITESNEDNNTIEKTIYVRQYQQPDNPPTIDPLDDITLELDNVTHYIELTGISDGDPDQEQYISIDTFSSNEAVATVSVNYYSPSTVGSLHINLHSAGTTTITVRVSDGTNEITESFILTVTEPDINHPPTISDFQDMILEENAGLQTVYFSNVTDGDDGTQTVTIRAESGNTSLIPSVDVHYTGGTTGYLTFTPVQNRTGVAIINVYVEDDGGTANGGQYQTLKSFRVTINETQPQVITQQITLSKGWNLVSFNVTPENTDLQQIFSDLINSGKLIKVINSEGHTMERLAGGWYNGIGNWTMEDNGYYVKVNQNCTLTVTGEPIPSPFSQTLINGWQIMSYPLDHSQNAFQALQQLINNNQLIKLLDEQGNAIEYINGTWTNQNMLFEPGKAYYIKIKNGPVNLILN